MSYRLIQNLQRRLSALNSKESVLTLSNWLVFYRKRSFIDELVSTVKDKIVAESSEQRRKLYFGVLHEIVIHSDENIPGGLDDFKLYLVPYITKHVLPHILSSPALRSDIEKMITEWEFVVENIGLGWEDVWSKIVMTPNEHANSVKCITKPCDESVPKDEEDNQKLKGLDDQTLVDRTAEERPLKRMRSLEEANDALHAEMIPQCKSIATMQITYELRRDAFTRLSNTLSLLTESDRIRISQDQLEDDAKFLPEAIIDLDIDESKKTVSAYRDTIQQLMVIKRKLMCVLIGTKLEDTEDSSKQIRCKFGADESVKDFLSISEKLDRLKEKRIEVEDELALEGLDVNDSDCKIDSDDCEEKFAPFTWFALEEKTS